MHLLKKDKVDRTVLIGALAIMLAALLWSLDGTFIRPKLYHIQAPLVVFLEHSLGFLFLFPFLIISWQKIKKLRRKDWLAISWVALFGGVIGTIFITKAFFAAVGGEVTFATVVILQKLQPVFALILAALILKEKLSRQFYFWALLAVTAAYFLAFGKTGLAFSGIDWRHNAAIFAFIAAFAFGSSTVLGKRIVNHLDFMATSALRFGITGAIIIIYLLFSGGLKGVGSITSTEWHYFWLIVFTSGAGAIAVYYYGLRKVTASTATIAELFWPFSAVILDYFLNKNVLNSLQIGASIVLLMAFFMVVKYGQPASKIFSARVISGAKRGRELGFPTANLDEIDMDIPYGVYAAEIILGGNKYKAALHFGPKDTFSEGPSNEISIKNFNGDIYGQVVEVEILGKIRDIKRFENVEELKAAIRKDLEAIS